MRFKEIILSENNLEQDDQSDASIASKWIDEVYEMYPQQFRDNHIMPWNEDEFALFKLKKRSNDTVEIEWIQAYPLRSGIGTKAMAKLQELAKKDNISLTLYPWDKGIMSQPKLIRIYKKMGFEPLHKGSKHMIWRPKSDIGSS